MREIKFRAFNKQCSCETCGGTFTSWERLLKIEYTTNPDQANNFFEDDGYVLEQFTGLHDKNGKEIYEGDVVKYISIHDDAYMLDKDSRITGIIVYYQDRCQFLPQEIRKNHKGGHYVSTWEFTEDVAVIGNIHENPELLEELA